MRSVLVCVFCSFLLLASIGCGSSGSVSSNPQQNPPNEVEVQFSASASSITSGDSVSLTWQTKNATAVTVEPGMGTVASSGSITVHPASDTTYTLSASNATSAKQQRITVTVTPREVPPPPPPATVQFKAEPTTIVRGETATLSWSTTNATSVSLDQGIGAVDLTGQRAVKPDQTTTYTITAVGAGGTATASVTVTVNEPPPPTLKGVLSWKGDASRSGLYNDSQLTAATVTPTTFGKLGQYFLDGLVVAQPLYVADLDMGDKGKHNVVIAVTANASIYAFDADAKSSTPLWKRSVLPEGAIAMPENFGGRTTFDGQVGITGTPVIDPLTGYLYCVSAMRTAEGIDQQWLHAIDIRTGNDAPAGSVKITAVVDGNGLSSVNGKIYFNPSIQNQRPGLLLLNGVVYIAWGSFSDQGGYHGWIMAYDANTLAQRAVFNSATQFEEIDIGGDHGGGAAFWAGGAALSADPDGNIYVTTGDGSFNADTQGPNYGDAVLKMRLVGSTLQVLDWFTPSNQDCINAADLELGAGGVALLPSSVGNGRNLAAVMTKEGRLYLLDRDTLGHFNPAGDTQAVQSFMVGAHECVLGQTTGEQADGANWNRLYGTPSYWNGNLYLATSNGPVVQYKFDAAGKLTTTPASKSSNLCGLRGCNTVVSTSGDSAIVWAYEKRYTADANNSYALLHAYDANDLSRELWNSDMNPTRDRMMNGTAFATPVVANGHVYTSWHHFLVIYGPVN